LFAYHHTRARVDVAFTDRHGGVSGGPYASLDLGDRSGDRAANLAILAEAFTGSADTPVVLMRQVHGASVVRVGERPDRTAPEADALVTSTPGVVLAARAADCVPVLLADPERGLVGAVHAGRPGLVSGVVPAAVEALRELGARRLVAWVGPHVCGACYEVPEGMRADVTAVVPESYAETSWGTPSVDIGAGVVAQLRAAGGPWETPVEVVEVSRCTREDDDLFSYRRQGPESGRLAGVVRVRP
jgi:YfiH family protein